VEKDCRARGLNMEDAMCRSRWRKQIGMIIIPTAVLSDE